MADLAEARRLAIKLGFVNDDGTPGANWFAADNPLREMKAIREYMDPKVITPASQSFGYAQPAYAPQALSAGRPPVITELPPDRYFQTDNTVELDRFAGNPGETLYRTILPGAKFAYAAPTMFAAGDLPIITGSGVDPQVLMWCAWYLRHSAALTDSRAHVLEIIESSSDTVPDPEGGLQTDRGRDRWQDYRQRIGQWVSTPPQALISLTDGDRLIKEQMQKLYGPDAGE
jgi:hypothetical protein